MKTLTIQQVSKDLMSVSEHSLKTHEEINIATEKGAVVILPEEDYESMQETLRLLSDKEALTALLNGHKKRDKGKSPESFSVQDVFSDL